VNGKAGFVVADMADVDEFTPPIADAKLPDAPLYVISDLVRDSKFTEHWGVANLFSVLAQLGVLALPA